MPLKNRLLIHKKIFYFLILLFAFSIPLWSKITPVIVILLYLNYIIELDFKKKFQRLNKNLFYFFVIVSFYLIHFLGLINTVNFEFARFDLEIKMTFFLFPLLFFTSDLEFFDNIKLKYVLLSFVFGCFLSSFISVLHSLYLYLPTHDINLFFYVYISFFNHSSYVSLYIVFALGVIFHLFFNCQLNKILKNSLLFVFIWFIVYIILLSSKAGLISLFAALFLFFVFYIIKTRKTLLSILFFVFTLLFVIAGINIIPASVNRMTPAINAMKSSHKNINAEDGTVQRIEIWKVSYEMFKDYPLLGVGTGDVKDELLKKYDEKGMNFAKSFKLNAHGQFFQTAVALGSIGLLSLIIMFLIPFIYSVKKQNFIYIYFIIIVVFSITVESMFEKQAGVLFFTFFNSFLFAFSEKLALKDKFIL